MAKSEYEMDDAISSTAEATIDGHVWGSIVAGATIGILVGGALALLWAPKAGNELRSDLGGAVDDLRERAEQLIDDLQDTTQDLIVRSRDTLDTTRQNLARSVEAGKEAYEQKRDELSARFDS